MNVKRFILICFGLLLAATGCEQRKGDSKDYVIGALYPMGGRAARYGEDSKAAALMAVEEVNASGGIHGRRLSVVFRDDESSVDRARQLAREYILRDHVDFLMGTISSAAALAVSDVSKQNKTIFVGTDAASSKLTYDNFQPYFFRVSNNTYQSMAAQALYASRMNWKTYYVIGPDYEYGHALWDDFVAKMKSLGADMQVLGQAWPKLYEPDYTSFISAIAAAKPDVVVANFWGGDMVAFVKQANAVHLFDHSILLSCDAGGNYETFEALGDHIPTNAVLSARHHLNWPATAENRTFVESFLKKTGRYPTYAAEGAYVGIHFIAKALSTAPAGASTEALIKTMEQIRIKCPEDPPGFESYMDVMTHQMVQVQAVGRVLPNTEYPPATRMLGHWKTYEAATLLPSTNEVNQRRTDAQSRR